MAWEQLARCSDASVTPNADKRLMKAVRAIQLQEHAAASRLLADFLAEEPKSWIALDLAAYCALTTGQYEAALTAAMQCTTLNPNWARGWTRLGAAQLCLNHYRAAVSAYQKALAMEGGNKEALLGVELAQRAEATRGGQHRAARHDVHC